MDSSGPSDRHEVRDLGPNSQINQGLEVRCHDRMDEPTHGDDGQSEKDDCCEVGLRRTFQRRK